jgi:hypothetical protein
MQKLNRTDLWSLEQYSEERPAFRAEVIAHKKARRVAIGPHATLCFEDALTMKYQIQEMLRVEKIFEAAEIEEELTTYNPPMGGIEDTIWVQIGDGPRIYAIANEDMPRSEAGKAAAVHFLRFELDGASVQAAKEGAPILAGIDHASLKGAVTLDPARAESLRRDLD